MELVRGATRIYACPFCQVDTPHKIAGSHGSTYGIMCGNCRSGSLVGSDALLHYQERWEEELREILQELGSEGDE